MYMNQEIENFIKDQVDKMRNRVHDAAINWVKNNTETNCREYLIQENLEGILETIIMRLLDKYLVNKVKEAKGEAVRQLSQKVDHVESNLANFKLSLQTDIEHHFNRWIEVANPKIDGIIALYESCTQNHHFRLMEIEEKLKKMSP